LISSSSPRRVDRPWASSERQSRTGALWTVLLLLGLTGALREGTQYIGTIEGSRPICGTRIKPYRGVVVSPDDRTIGLAVDMKAPALEEVFCAQHALAPRIVKAVDANAEAIRLQLRATPVLVDPDAYSDVVASLLDPESDTQAYDVRHTGDLVLIRLKP
jgi:hypothetical protein